MHPLRGFLLYPLIVFILSVSFASPVLAKVIYVSPSGSDYKNGLTVKKAVRTISRAVDIVEPGDTIQLLGGTYTGALISRRGKANAWITMMPYKNQKVIIKHRGGGRPTLYFYHKSCDEDRDKNYPCKPMHWIIKGLTITGSGQGGSEDNVIKIDTPYVKIINNDLSGSSADIIKLVNTADNVEIRNNNIHHPNAKRGANAQGVDITGADNTLVVGNHVHHIPSIGMYAKGNSRNIIFEKNRVEHTWQHGIMLGQSTDSYRLRDGKYESYDGIIRNNLIQHTGWSCVATASSFNVRIYNNTCYDVGQNHHGAVLVANESEVEQAGTNITIRNNIFVAANRKPIIKVYWNALTDPKTLFIDHNIYWSLSGKKAIRFTWKDLALHEVSPSKWRQKTGLDKNSIFANPKFEDKNLFQLAPGSPAINKGFNTKVVTDDFSGNRRPVGKLTDIGAHEKR